VLGTCISRETSPGSGAFQRQVPVTANTTHSFSAPELTTIAPAGNYSSGKLEFEPYEPNLSIDLPKLAFVNGSVEIHGMINRFVIALNFIRLHSYIGTMQVLN
jgi:hypothetical protein